MTIDRSTPDLGALYQEVILDHYKRPRNRGAVDPHHADVQMRNPSCGDEIRLQFRVEDGRIAEIAFTGIGCALSQASSSMMTDLVKGKTLEEGLAIARRFTEMVHGDADAARDKLLGQARSLQGVSRFADRVKCSMLAWDAFQEGARQADASR
jgi:nitrogen fixation NifU-like protein